MGSHRKCVGDQSKSNGGLSKNRGGYSKREVEHSNELGGKDKASIGQAKAGFPVDELNFCHEMPFLLSDPAEPSCGYYASASNAVCALAVSVTDPRRGLVFFSLYTFARYVS